MFSEPVDFTDDWLSCVAPSRFCIKEYGAKKEKVQFVSQNKAKKEALPVATLLGFVVQFLIKNLPKGNAQHVIFFWQNGSGDLAFDDFFSHCF